MPKFRLKTKLLKVGEALELPMEIVPIILHVEVVDILEADQPLRMLKVWYLELEK